MRKTNWRHLNKKDLLKTLSAFMLVPPSLESDNVIKDLQAELKRRGVTWSH